jgi:predicted O-methyltransferase YrrM
MTTENRAHRSHELNPRRHPKGKPYRNVASKRKLWAERNMQEIALLSKDEQQFLQDVPRRLGPGDYVNLGHCLGGSAFLLANGLLEHELEGRVYSVELEFSRKARNRLKLFAADTGPITICHGSTDDQAASFRLTRRGMSINFVFIDADHTYAAVMKDFQNWSPMVRVGGWVCFHDTNQDFSHQAIKDSVLLDNNWRERGEDHIDRIRTFERIS